jgi:hypothetical protein
MSAAATTSRLIIRAAASAILTVLMSVCCALIVVAATATFNFGYFFQTAGSQFGHRCSHGNCVGIENPDTTTAQVVEHSTANTASTNDVVDLLRRCTTSAGAGINSDAIAADAIDHIANVGITELGLTALKFDRHGRLRVFPGEVGKSKGYRRYPLFYWTATNYKEPRELLIS